MKISVAGLPPLVRAIRAYAVDRHGAQRYGAHPYVYHLDAVVRLLAPYGCEAQALGYLHDLVEDTTCTLDELRQLWGPHVADCVALLTDERGATRKERKSKTYVKLAAVTWLHETALIVKVADRLANLIECVHQPNPRYWKLYYGEHRAFKLAVWRPGLCDELWARADALIQTWPAKIHPDQAQFATRVQTQLQLRNEQT